MATITSIGYEGRLRENGFARLMRRFAGLEHAVGGDGDWIVTAVPNADRTVSVAANIGEAYCCGVADTADGPFTVQSASVASGTRWDTIVARRDWRPDAAAGGGATTVMVLTGTSALDLAGTRERSPGIVFDQPLALIQYVAGQAQPAQIVDLRVRVVLGCPLVGSADAAAALSRAGLGGAAYPILAAGGVAGDGPMGATNPRFAQSMLANQANTLATATNAPTANSLARRDDAGRIQVGAAASYYDAVQQGQLSAAVTSLQASINSAISQGQTNTASVAALLDVRNASWTQAAGSFGNTNQWLTEIVMPTYARPYRWQVVVSADMGSTAAGTRWDLGVGYDGTSGNADGTFFDGTVGVDGQVYFQRFTSAISGVVATGKQQRIYVVARRVYGSALGSILSTNRRFTVHAFSA